MIVSHSHFRRLALIALILFCKLSSSLAVELKSPDGQVTLSFGIKDFEGREACAVYSVTARGRPIVSDSHLGLEFRSNALGAGFRIIGEVPSRGDSVWEPVYGERSKIRDRYNQVSVELELKESPHLRLQLNLRAYNEGVAFRYVVPAQSALPASVLTRELTEFRLPADYQSWATYTAQGAYTKVRVSEIRSGCERPLVLQAADDLYVALAEAGLVDYARMKFAPLAGVLHALVAELAGEVRCTLPLQTPWRVIMVADSPGGLLENNDLILNLNAPCALTNTSWIKPGKVIRDCSLTTRGAKACVDFAGQHNLQYIHFDAGWYGREDAEQSDARQVNLDPARSAGPLNLPEVIAYARQQNIGTLLYVNRRALERQLDELLPLYQSWGIEGIKFGFVRVGSQEVTSWLHNAIRKAADHQLMVDVHDEYRPTGWSRTYPNLMTQEGVRGDEELQPNSMALTSLFTRFLAGPADNTICYFDDRVRRNSSHAYQLAKAVCFYSPWQFLYWYDQPASHAGTNALGTRVNLISDEPELEFFDQCPTVWDDTKVLQGEIGESAIIARRSGTQWFIGCMNANRPRTFTVSLGFLERGKTYRASVYADDPAIQTRTHVRIEHLELTAESKITMTVSAQGGQAVRLVPVTAPGATVESALERSQIR